MKLTFASTDLATRIRKTDGEGHVCVALVAMVWEYFDNNDVQRLPSTKEATKVVYELFCEVFNVRPDFERAHGQKWKLNKQLIGKCTTQEARLRLASYLETYPRNIHLELRDKAK